MARHPLYPATYAEQRLTAGASARWLASAAVLVFLAITAVVFFNGLQHLSTHSGPAVPAGPDVQLVHTQNLCAAKAFAAGQSETNAAQLAQQAALIACIEAN